MLRCPLSLPLSKSYGARPTRAVICLRLIFPSSGNRAMSVKASTGAVLRHVDTAKREYGHLRIPSLLMRARALATVRVWKTRPEHQAHSRSDIRDACRLPVATGAEL